MHANYYQPRTKTRSHHIQPPSARHRGDMNEGTTQMRGEWSSCANVSAHTLLYTYAHPVTFSGPSLRPTIESAPEIRFYVFRRAGRTLLPSARRAFSLSGHIAAARFERQTQSLAPRQRRPTVTRCDELRGPDPLICDDLALHRSQRGGRQITPPKPLRAASRNYTL